MATVHAIKHDEPEMLTIEQFAKRVHRRPKTIYDWIKKNKLPARAVVSVYGHMEIDWNIAKQFIRPIN